MKEDSDLYFRCWYLGADTRVKKGLLSPDHNDTVHQILYTLLQGAA